MKKNKRKSNKIKKNVENMLIRVLAFIIFISPCLFYCLCCYITNLF